ncbi:MAG TPA: PDZ domain-containing protein [Thermoanaerobaculia bacterium]|nr:PDZ domain-containing protein [Thermoanaerobaculia bacterium]
MRTALLAAAVAALLVTSSALAVDIHDTRLLTDAAVSGEKIAFAYANDLWVANLDGSGVRRLTSHPGVESRPTFSPDGAWIAFAGEYDGNTDVYIVPAEGGSPQRLTWHPGVDLPQGFTADGSAVLFTSPREVYTMRYRQLFTVPIGGGAVSKLPIPNASKAVGSPDGSKIVYQPLSDAFGQWKHYRGGTAARLLVFDNKTYAVEQIPQPAGRSNDTDPMWIGNRVYFLSDRSGEFNLFSWDLQTRGVTQHTRHADFPVAGASAGGGKIIFERAGYLHLFDPATSQERRLQVGVAADLLETRPRFVKGAKYIRSASLSPSGARAALEFRGEIITVPAEKGDDRNLTGTPAAHDRFPSWSPDGKSIAWFSDESGEYQLFIQAQDGKGTPRKIALNGAGFYAGIRWSPDSSKIAFTDNSRSLYVLDVPSGATRKISTQPIYSPGAYDAANHAWSPDSKWLAYVRRTPTYMGQIHLYSTAAGSSQPLTDGLSDASEPVFDRDGKYLYFLVSTNAGPVQDWFSMSNADMRATSNIYLAVLPKGVPSPLARESDEEAAAPAPAETTAKTAKKDEEKEPKKVDVRVDFDGLSQRIVALPVDAGGYFNLQAGKAGEIHYLKSAAGRTRFSSDPGTLHRFSFEKRKEESLVEKVDSYEISRDAKKVLLRMKESWVIAELGEKVDASKHKLAVDRIEVRIDPRAEWKQIFNEAWRINRDYFYDPGMHGADWKAMRAKYVQFLPHLSVRQDLNRVLRWMHSELAVGHHRVGGGDSLADTDVRRGGLLGADYKVENGRYRFARVYGGLNWNPNLRSPLTEPGVDVKAGEYLLAVEGKDLRHPENLYSRFERTAGRITEITVGPSPDGRGSRTVQVVPVESEIQLRNRDWVEGNLRKVTAATGGRVAYVYVPNTSIAGHEYFKRYFFPQADREAIIVDERHNGGGLVADYYIDILRRPFISMWAFRYGADLKTPLSAIHGPKVMLIDETAGSGGDLLPWMFRKLEMGPLVGKRTWGGLVGTLGFPTLMDGGTITAPNLAIWTEDGFIVENVGVPPDVEIEQTPADVIAGRDPQLEKAIEIVLQLLQANPPKKLTRPPFPVRALGRQ